MKSELTIVHYTPQQVAEICKGTLAVAGEGEISTVCTDSREVVAGSLFCAIKGEKADGHDYIARASQKGATCVLAERMPSGNVAEGTAIVLVSNTVYALGELAADYRRHADVKIIGVTGSVGKTTTKEFIASVVSQDYVTHKTAGNHNSDIGFPMTIFSIHPEHRISVLEMGMSHLGEIERMSQIAHPDFAVITNVGTAHLEFLGTRENIARAKMEIAAGMDGKATLLLNGDEPLLIARMGMAVPQKRLISLNESNGDYRAVNLRTTENGMVFDMICEKNVVTNVAISMLGEHNVRNALAAYAIGHMLGISEGHIRAGLLACNGAAMRQNIYDRKGVTYIEDCYNASPESMRAALDVLAGVAVKKDGRPLALLGDMLELGDDSYFLHDEIGKYAAKTRVAKLFCYGRQADIIAQAAIKAGIRAENVSVSLDTNDPQTMADMVLHELQTGDVLLVKASRGIAAERVLELVKKGREKA